MVKEHVIRLIISNKSGLDITYSDDWYDSGRLADSYSWPKSIPNGENSDVMSYEKDWALAGCSGSVNYVMNGTAITFAFSNPLVGYNKVGVGLKTSNVWDNMYNHNYDPFVVQLTIEGKRYNFNCKCTGGTTNTATVDITSA